MADSNSGKKNFTVRRIVFIAIIIPVLVQLLSYLFFADAAMMGTIPEYFPWKTHFREDTRFRLVCIDKETWQSLTSGQKKALKNILQEDHEDIYTSMDNVPDSEKIYYETDDGKMVFSGFKNGWLLCWEKELSLPFYFEAFYSDYEGNLAASSGSAGYIWVFGFWVRVWNGGRWIS